MPNFMFLGSKTSELGGGKVHPPGVWSVFKSPGKIGLRDLLKNILKQGVDEGKSCL